MSKLDLNDSIGMLIALASKEQDRFAETEMKKQLGLTSTQWKVILILNLNQGLTQKEIADKIFVDGSTLVPVLDKMERNELIERKADPSDRRLNRIFLTKKSEGTVDSIVEIILRLRKIFYKGISKEEIDLAKKVLRTVLNNVNNELSNNESTG